MNKGSTGEAACPGHLSDNDAEEGMIFKLDECFHDNTVKKVISRTVPISQCPVNTECQWDGGTLHDLYQHEKQEHSDLEASGRLWHYYQQPEANKKNDSPPAPSPSREAAQGFVEAHRACRKSSQDDSDYSLTTISLSKEKQENNTCIPEHPVSYAFSPTNHQVDSCELPDATGYTPDAALKLQPPLPSSGRFETHPACLAKDSLMPEDPVQFYLQYHRSTPDSEETASQ